MTVIEVDIDGQVFENGTMQQPADIILPPMGTLPPKRAPRRIPQSERRATSARKIIKATIRCIYRSGYGATTVDAVLKEANVSRGRLLHHFPSRTDLMIAVGRYVWELDKRYARRWNRQYPDARERLLNSVDLAWTMLSRSTGMAVLEILVASRSDPDLAKRFVPAHIAVQEEANQHLYELLDENGLLDRVDAYQLHHYVEACIRGLAIDQIFSGERDRAPPALEFLREQIAHMVETFDTAIVVKMDQV